MSNTCLTQYYFEGPADEIRNFGNQLLWTFSQYPFEEADEDDKSRLSPEEYEQHFVNIVAALEMPAVFDPRGFVQTRITEDAYCPLPKGELSLHFHTESAWGPAQDIWDYALKKWAPHSRYYYYAEEFGVAGVWTNDLEGKYFSWDYVIYANLSEKIPAIIREALSQNFIAPALEDGYHEHCTYWKEAALRKALLTFVRYPDWSTEDLFYVVDKDLSRCMQKLDSYLRFYRVQYLG